ncbi:hypothetical protein M406DRAFT_70003 [Cryphonectria parasitica EP155]|uniref:Uncharacterized protein n=1 Tax=Cryphonectria parasitica (strain ATCC 38755 / EP155) TaxID=660469 RepID=A0A9P5CRU5_CRYP1|nr:uncharacterized protein M406DRAFT_70003 [Cryphonectria parasitica EP155]KAF3767897.1 hypothetical protein M406DRAFT_70003 [Cryphonectria parasitica EP155]
MAAKTQLSTLPAVVQERGVIGSRVHTIRNLAVSAALVQSSRRVDSEQEEEEEEEEDGTRVVSNWDSYMFQGIARFENLRRVDVVFGPVPMETRCDGYKTDRDCWAAAAAREQVGEPYTGRSGHTHGHVRRAGATAGGGGDPGVGPRDYWGIGGRGLGPRPRSRQEDIGQGQEDATTAAPGGQQQQQQQKRVAEVVHRDKDLSKVTFYAARMVETARFRGRTIRKSFPPRYFSEHDSNDEFESLSSHGLLPTRKKRLVV